MSQNREHTHKVSTYSMARLERKSSKREKVGSSPAVGKNFSF